MNMSTVNFVPASTVTYTEGSGRQLKFEQSDKGDVIVKVKYGLHTINTVFQNNVTVNRGPHTPLEALNNLSKGERKIVLDTIGRGNGVKITTANGTISNVASRQFNGNYSQVASITISY
jgi:hypothetical protein